jgi:hypothetical protein
MAKYAGRRDFRAGPAMTLLVVFCALLFAAGAVMTYRLRGWNWVSIGLGLMTVVGIGGIIETLILRVRLTDDALEVTDLRGRRRYRRSEIARVEEAKGAPTAILLAEGGWVKLPSVGSSMGNSIRAWLASH